jgi:predicted secreted protein
MITKLIVFFILWWIVFMLLIPCWIKVSSNTKKGHAEGAPADPKIRKKALWATAITIILY